MVLDVASLVLGNYLTHVLPLKSVAHAVNSCRIQSWQIEPVPPASGARNGQTPKDRCPERTLCKVEFLPFSILWQYRYQTHQCLIDYNPKTKSTSYFPKSPSLRRRNTQRPGTGQHQAYQLQGLRSKNVALKSYRQCLLFQKPLP